MKSILANPDPPQVLMTTATVKITTVTAELTKVLILKSPPVAPESVYGVVKSPVLMANSKIAAKLGLLMAMIPTVMAMITTVTDLPMSLTKSPYPLAAPAYVAEVVKLAV